MQLSPHLYLFLHLFCLSSRDRCCCGCDCALGDVWQWEGAKCVRTLQCLNQNLFYLFCLPLQYPLHFFSLLFSFPLYLSLTFFVFSWFPVFLLFLIFSFHLSFTLSAMIHPESSYPLIECLLFILLILIALNPQTHLLYCFSSYYSSILILSLSCPFLSYFILYHYFLCHYIQSRANCHLLCFYFIYSRMIKKKQLFATLSRKCVTLWPEQFYRWSSVERIRDRRFQKSSKKFKWWGTLNLSATSTATSMSRDQLDCYRLHDWLEVCFTLPLISNTSGVLSWHAV